jgi:hypothetical protein
MGKVYIIVNEWMPGVAKIGKTERNVSDRIREISTNSSPKGWEEYFSIESEKYEMIEKHMHNVFSDKRIWKEREYFEVEPERAVSILKSALELCGGSETRIEIIEEEDKDAQRKPRGKILPLTDYAPIGSELVFTRDENIKCKIIDKRQVEYEGEIYSSLSNLASKLVIEKLHYANPHVAGTDFFMYNDRILNEIRDEIYENNEL